MVKESNKTTTKDGRTIQIKQMLTCKDYGIYAAKCKICSDFYVGQTITAFHKRWSAHRKSWNDMINQEMTSKSRTVYKEDEKNSNQNDKNALFLHCKKHHKGSEKSDWKQLADYYEISFVEKSRKERLDVAESWWISKLKAGINISRTVLPKY